MLKLSTQENQATGQEPVILSKLPRKDKSSGASQGVDDLQDFKSWQDEFLARRDLTRPNGDMLFAYRASKEEYLSLRALFAAKLAALGGASWTFGSVAECACFVLYSAEWWHREYAGGAWRWTHILESLWPVFNVDVLERTYAVERGLRAWGHQPSGAGKRYLGAIVAQGGLPLQLVAKGDGAITRLLIRGTSQAQQYAWDSTRLEGFFAAHEQELVQHLQDDDIYRLLASVVLTVLALRHECQLAGASNPVEVLDRTLPSWRDRFPMAVDDSSAEPLLVGLVREAAREVKAVVAYPVLATRTLHQRAGGQVFELALALEMPSSISLEALAGACGVPASTLPQAFGLEAVGAGRVSLGDARQLLGSAQSTVMLTGRTQRVFGNAALQEHQLVLRGAGADLHAPIAIPGADALEDTLPWVFAVRETELVLAAVGSCRLTEDCAFVAVPEGIDIVAQGDQSRVSLVGETEGVTPVRWIYEVSGHAAVVTDDGTYRVGTSQDTAAAEQLIWRGVRAPYGARPMPVYQGVPQLCRLTADGALLPVAASCIEWVMPVPQGARVATPRTHRGPIDAWLVQDGVRQRRFRMALVSTDARVRFRSGESEREGRVELHGWGFSSLAAPKSMAPQQNVQPDLSSLDLACTLQPPATVDVSLCWPHSDHSVHLALPFPATGGRFFGLNGMALAHGLALPLRRLQEVRAQVFSRNPEAPKRYTLSMELVGGDGVRLVVEHPIPLDLQGFGEVRLLELESSVRGLMCQSNALDARLEVRICLGHAAIANLRLTRYDADLESRSLSMVVSEGCLAGLSAEQLMGAKLLAMPLLTRNAIAVELTQRSSEGVPVGCWDVAHLAASQGPWLVYPSLESGLQLRPTLYAGFAIGTQQAGVSDLCPLGAAMALKDADARKKAITAVVTDMSADLDHPSWILITRQYQLLSHLPLSTLDYWRAIGRDVNAALAAALKLSFDVATLMIRMRDELGVIWELMPKSALSRGVNLLSQTWSRQFKVNSDDTLVRTLVEPLFRSVGQVDPILSELVDLVLFQAGFKRSEGLDRLITSVAQGPRSQLQQLWSGEGSHLQRFLLRTHAEDRIWPTFELTQALVKTLETDAPALCELLFKKVGRELLWLPTAGQAGPFSKNMKQDVANVPLLAGLLAQVTPPEAAWRVTVVISQIRRIRSFDPGWFDVSCRTGTLLAIMLTEHAQPTSKTLAAPGASTQLSPREQPHSEQSRQLIRVPKTINPG